MKKLIVLLIFSLSFGWFVFAQNNNDETEKASPMQNAELIRKVCFLDIEGEVIYRCSSCNQIHQPRWLFSDKYRVKVKVTDSNGKTVWNKTMKNAYLYVFSDGQIQIGRPKFSQLVIYSGKRANKYEKGIIREKEGVYNQNNTNQIRRIGHFGC